MRRSAGSLRRSLGLFLPVASSPTPKLQLWNSNIEVKLGVCQQSGFATRSFDVCPSSSRYGGLLQFQRQNYHKPQQVFTSERDSEAVDQDPKIDSGELPKQRIGRNLSSTDKRTFLVNTLFDLKDSKEAVYGTLDAWVAWEKEFPLPMLKRALLVLEKKEQWHRIVQVLKWILSKGQGTTMNTYKELIRALEKDNRPEEAHNIWVMKLSHDLHSVPWRVCELMISIYYRNNMLERLVKLFTGLEEYDRKPPSKSIVRKVADAYEMLGLVEEKSRILGKYAHLFDDSSKKHSKKSRMASRKNDRKDAKKQMATREEPSDNSPVDSGPSDEETDIAS